MQKNNHLACRFLQTQVAISGGWLPVESSKHPTTTHLPLFPVHFSLPAIHYAATPFSLSLLIVLTLLGCTPEDDSWQRVQEAGVLRVGVDPTYPPFAFDNGTAISGIDIDLANALGEQLGVDIEMVLFGYDGLYDALGTAQVDVLISALVVAPERTRDFAYSEPYFNAGELLVVPVEESEIEEVRDLNGRSLAVELGAQGHVEATAWERSLPDLTVLPQESADAALRTLLTEEADAALADAISVRLFLTRNKGITTLTHPVTVDPFAIVVRSEDETLLEQVNKALAHIKESGRLEAILEQGFAP